MNLLLEVYAYVKGNWEGILMVVALLHILLELIVRLTPTKSDDGYAVRVGKFTQYLFDLAKVPNMKADLEKKILGVLPAPAGKHESKEESK